MRFAASCVLILLSGHALASSSLSLSGVSGALVTPTGFVIPAGQAGIQTSNNALISSSREYREARTYALAIGLLPRVELSGQLAAADRGRRGGYNDLSANLKVSLFENEYLALAAGLLDFAGDAQRSASAYGAVSYTYRQFVLSAGYAQGKARRDAVALDGPFGSLIVSPIPHVELLADYDSEHYSAGTRLSYQFPSSTKISATAKLYSDGPQKSAFGLGISRNLDFRKDAEGQTPRRAEVNSLFDGLGNGLGNVSLAKIDGDVLLRAENRAFQQRQADSDRAACATAGTAKTIQYRQLRHGLPIISTPLDCVTDEAGPSQWWTMLDDLQAIQQDFTSIDAYAVEIKLTPDLRSFAGTEVGIFDYSVALFSTARLQLPAGIGAYVTYESPLSETKNFHDPFLFDFYRHRSGIREAQVEWAHHLVPGFFGLHSYGLTRQFAIDYRSQRNDLVWFIGDGKHQFYASEARYKPEDNPFLPKRELHYAGYRYWWLAFATSIEADYGKFFYGDTGFRVKASRHFGDTIVSLFLKRADKENQVAGLQLSFPLTPRKALSAGGASLVGTSRFDFDRGTSFGQSNGRNEIKPLLLVEPKPSYQLRTEWLDVDRLFPAYPASER